MNITTDYDREIRISPDSSGKVLTIRNLETNDFEVALLTTREALSLAEALIAPNPPSPIALGDIIARGSSMGSPYVAVVVAITGPYVITKDSDDDTIQVYTVEDAIERRSLVEARDAA